MFFVLIHMLFKIQWSTGKRENTKRNCILCSLPLLFSLYCHITPLQNIDGIQNQWSAVVQQNNCIKNLANTQKSFCVIILFKIKWLWFSLQLYWKQLQCSCFKLAFVQRASWQLLLSIQATDFHCILKYVFLV